MSCFNENITFYAFRYALGRKTYAAFETAQYIQVHWEEFSKKTQKIIYKEIEEAIELGRAGMEMDELQWKKILSLASQK